MSLATKCLRSASRLPTQICIRTPAASRAYTISTSKITTPSQTTRRSAISIRHASLRFSSTTAAAESSDLSPPDYLSEGELKIYNILKSELQPLKLEVQDISGGCGSMYGLDIVSSHFKGLSVIKQHRLVNKVLAEEIKGWHGVQLKTKAP